MLTAVLLAAALTAPGPEGLETVALGLGAADVASTTLALRAGWEETNPVARPFADDVPRLILFKATTTVGPLLAARYVERRGHRKLAKGIRVGLVVVQAVAVGVNVRNAARRR